MLLTAMIFAVSADARKRIQWRSMALGDLNLFRSPELRPSPPEIIGLINSYSPELIIVQFHDVEDVLNMEAAIHSACPNVAILGFADHWPFEPLIKTSRGPVRVVSANLPVEVFRQSILETIISAGPSVPDNVIVFLPAKAGSGASTLALNVTGALANKCAKSAVLIEADLHSGPAGMYLNLKPAHSVVDALKESRHLEARWNELITPVGPFAILPACNIRGPVPQPPGWPYRRLMAYARPRYEFVIFDLPEVVNPATEAIVTGAKTVYIVCTPEVPSLLLARKRHAELIDRGVAPDHLQIVLNRYAKDGPDPAAISEILGFPIGQLIPNDYQSLWKANLQRRLVEHNSTVGRAIEQFAWSLTGRAVKPNRKMFGLFPAA
jgi:Flp pilus assembly CpaE family ATPase